MNSQFCFSYILDIVYSAKLRGFFATTISTTKLDFFFYKKNYFKMLEVNTFFVEYIKQTSFVFLHNEHLHTTDTWVLRNLHTWVLR